MNKIAIPKQITTCAHKFANVYLASMNIGGRLDQAMQNAGFKTQSALSRASGIPQPTINRILKGGGKKGPETVTIQKLAAATGVSFAWLNEGVEDDRDDPDIAAIVKKLKKLDVRDRSRMRGRIESWIDGLLGRVINDEEDRRNPLNFDRRSGAQ